MLLNGIYHDPSLFPEVFRLFKEQYPDHHLSLRFPNQIDTFSKVVIRVCMNDELFQKYILDPDRHQQSPVLKRFVRVNAYEAIKSQPLAKIVKKD